MCSHSPEGYLDLFICWQTFSQQQESAGPRRKHFPSLCIMFSNVPVPMEVTQPCPILRGGKTNAFCLFFQSVEGSNPKLSETKSVKFPGALKPGSEDVPKEKYQNGLQQGSLIICLVVQRIYFGGIKTHWNGVLMLV